MESSINGGGNGTAAGEREGRRRRKIVDRGSDRMALITGRIKNLSADPLSPRHIHSQSSPDLFLPTVNLHDDLQGNALRSSTSLRYEVGDSFDFGSKVQPQLRKCETNTDALRAPCIEVEPNLLLSPARKIPKASNNTEASPLNAYGIDLNLYSLKEISACIIGSESTRVLCSIVIAIVVVLSNISLPRNIVQSRSVIASNPLYALLLTDVAIVIGRLTYERRRHLYKMKKEEEEEEEVKLHNDADSWGGAVRVLEFGLVLHQTLRAVFIDCSFYAVIVVCGLSLL